MSIEAAIYSLILSKETLTDLIGDRLVPVHLSQGMALPAIVFKSDNTDEDITVDGALGLVEAQFRFDCWAATHGGAIELAAALRDALQDYSGEVSDVTIQHVRILNRGDVSGLNVEAEQLSRYGKFLDVNFSYES